MEEESKKKGCCPSVDEVHNVIRQSTMQFPRERLAVRLINHRSSFLLKGRKINSSFLQKFPDLKFKYVEEDQPEEFFVPYIWTLASKKIYWNPANIKLFTPESN